MNQAVKNITDNRKIIAEAANQLKELDQIECPVVHRFAPSCYLREITMPKHSIVIGKIHATEHFNIILKGECTVIYADGSKHHYKAPETFTSLAGVQKVVLMHEETVWQTVHVTDLTDLEEIEKEVIAESYDDLKIDGLINEAKKLLGV